MQERKQLYFENSFINLFSFAPLPSRDKNFKNPNNMLHDKISKAFLYCFRTQTENLDEN